MYSSLIGRYPNGNIPKVLGEWFEEGSELELRELPKRIKRLRMGLRKLIGTADWSIFEDTKSHIFIELSWTKLL